MFRVSMADCTSEEWLRDSANHLSYAFRGDVERAQTVCNVIKLRWQQTVAPMTQSLAFLGTGGRSCKNQRNRVSGSAKAVWREEWEAL